MSDSKALSSSERVLQLDVVRGLSILLVILAHTTIHPELHSFLYFPIQLLNRVGFSGVDIFFVLSGFLVGGLLMKEYQKTGNIVPSRFFVRRAFKVWPSLYVFLIAYCVFFVFVGNGSGQHGTVAERFKDWWDHEWPNFFHIQNYVPRRHATLALFWSLAIEEHFYLALPWVLILVFGLRSKQRASLNIGVRMTAAFLILATTCMLLRWYTYRELLPIYDKPGMIDGDLGSYCFFFPTHLRIDSLFCGVFLAYVVRFHGETVERLRPFRYLVLAASLCAWVPFYVGVTDRGMPWGMADLYLGAAGLVLYAHLSATAPADKRADKGILRIPMQIMAWLGMRSYAIYVWHGYFARPVAVRVTRLLGVSGDVPGFSGWAYDLIMISSAVFVGAITYELVELPGLRLRQRFAPATPPREPPVPITSQPLLEGQTP